MNNYEKLGLYKHNIDSYENIKNAFTKQDIVGIIHATGTGKSYNALELALDNKDKKIVYVVPSNGIIEHIKKIIEDNPNLDIVRDFPNLEFRTYQSFISLSREEIEDISCDLLILDEFHHIGAPVWGSRIDTFIETHPNLKIFGMTAYTVRDRGTSYERDMAESDGNELFSDNIVSRYDLCDAMLDGVLPKPIYKSAYVNLMGTAKKLEEKVMKLDASTKEYHEYIELLASAKKKINNAPSISSIFKKNIKPNGKYIYFCPPWSEEGTNDIETIKRQTLEYLKEFVPEENIVFYTSTSEMNDEGRINREAFYSDLTLDGKNVSNKLKIMFAINQYNEGIHTPNIDGVIMGRGTTSDIVYFEQLGRALAVRGNTKEAYEHYEMYSEEQLRNLCTLRDIPLKDDATKEDLIQKLIAPVVIDLTNNFDYIKELENNLKDRIKTYYESGLNNHREIKLKDASFDIEIENQDLYAMLEYVSSRLTKTWSDMYEYAKNYYEHYGNLEVPQHFKTNDGYTRSDVGIINLGTWVHGQRQRCNLESEHGQKLLSIGMRFENKISTLSWDEMYEYAKKYYEHHGNLEVPKLFKTNDGYTKSDVGIINLGMWISTQRQRCNLESERGQKLLAIGMRFENKISTLSWDEMYEYAKKYYEHHGNLEVPKLFKTNDGYTRSDNGTINLGKWIYYQRQKCNPESECGQKLLAIGMRFENKRSTLSWGEMYEYAKIYYEHHGNLEVPQHFKTNDGYTKSDNGTISLGMWVANQRQKCNLESERGQKLLSIGMRFENKISTLSWGEMYEYAKIYYEHYGNLEVPFGFKTNDGYTKDDNGTINLGMWVAKQRQRCNLESEQGQRLLQIGMIWSVRLNREEVENICISNNIDIKTNKIIIKHISIQELKSKIAYLNSLNIKVVDNEGKLHEIFNMSNADMKEKYGISLTELINNYYIKERSM